MLMITFFKRYLLVSGVLIHLLFIVLFTFEPMFVSKVNAKLINYYYVWQKEKAYKYLTKGRPINVSSEIKASVKKWSARPSSKAMSGPFEINGQTYTDIKVAIASLKPGDELLIAEGVYETPITITENNISITGVGHVIFQSGAANGKGFILAKGDDLVLNNIECKDVSVSDGNGACVRLEGHNLTLDKVYFHNSQQGVLETSKGSGVIKVHNSRFERLGFKGLAHGLYSNSASVYVSNSLFIATKDKGHSIKVRGRRLTLINSIILSLSSDDSRLIDMPNGGELTIRDSLLAQGPNSVNGQLIGYGLEKYSHTNNSITLKRNTIFLERLGVNYLLSLAQSDREIPLVQENNLIVGQDSSPYKDDKNIYSSERSELVEIEYPFYPKGACILWQSCPLN